MTIVEIVTGAVRRTVDLQEYLDPASEESAQADAYAWIKALRTAAVEGLPLRSRFTFRGDSLWWFAELYLHKDRAILEFLRTVAAIDALIEREQPQRLHLAQESEIVRLVASARNLPCDWDRAASPVAPRMDVRARALALASRLSRFRGGSAPSRHARVAAFVHRAFWREGAGDGGAESYIGPVLRAIEDRVGTDAVQYVGVGPRRNFRARRWWQALATGDGGAMVPIERYAAAAALKDSRALWRERYAIRDALWSSDDIRQHAVIRGCDAWPVCGISCRGSPCCSFRGRRGRWTKQPPRSKRSSRRSGHLRGSGRLGSRPRARSAVDEAFHSRVCSTASSIVTG